MFKQSMLVVWGLAIALSLIVESAGASDYQYRLGAQDKLRIHAQEWPALAGEFVVGAEGFVSLPIVGEVPAAGTRTSELAAEIGRRLSAKTSERLSSRAERPEAASVSVEVVVHRPFYIVGVVDKPGEYSYRPGMSLLQAVSIAGGFYRRDAGQLRIDREVISGVGDLNLQVAKRKELLAKYARLNAEKQDLTEISFPAELVGTKLDPRVVSLMNAERLILQVRRELIRGQIRSFKERIDLNVKEIESLHAQNSAEEKQFESVMKELTEVRSMVARGLTPAPRQLALERTLAEIEGKQRGIDTAIIKTQQSTSEYQQKIIEVGDERSKDIAAELQQTKVQIDEADQRIETISRLMTEAEGAAFQNQLLSDDRRVIKYKILRRENGQTREILATENDPVEPGDVIKVLATWEKDPPRT
jgi:exopolysaccharide production protein ExoF